VGSTAFNVGTTTINYIAQDAAGNSVSSCSIVVTVNDNENPTFTVPINDTICRNLDCTYNINPAITGDVTDESDNCSVGLNATYIDDITNLVSCNLAGYITRTWSLIDNSGNRTDKNQIIWVEPVVTLSVRGDTVCDGATTNIPVTSSSVATRGIRFTWIYLNNAKVSGATNSSGNGQNIGTSILQTLHNLDTVAQKVTYIITPWTINYNGNNACSGNQISIDVWVEPTPVIIATPQIDTICNGTNVNISLTSPSSPTRPVQIRYKTIVPSGVTVIPGTGAGLPNGTVIADLINNFTDSAKRVLFIITPYTRQAFDETEKCPGKADTVQVYVEPTAKVSLVNLKDTFCTNLRTDIVLHSVSIPTKGVRFRYTYIPDSPADLTFTYKTDTFGYQKNDIINDSFINHSSVPQGVTLWVEPYLIDKFGNAKCSGIPQSIYLQITPRLVMQDTAGTFVKGYNLRCHNDKSGAIYMFPYGGITAYSNYTKTDLRYFVNGDSIDHATSINSLSAGNYTLTVKDWSGCRADTTITLIEPTALGYQFKEKKAVVCLGESGIYYIQPSGGTYFDVSGIVEGYTVRWDTAGGGYPGALPYYGDTIHNVAFGYFSFTINDSNNCVLRGSTVVDQINAHILSLATINTFGDYSIRCNGESNGQINASLDVHVGSFNYYLMDLINDTINQYFDSASTVIFKNLPAGKFQVHSYDQDNCFSSATIELLQPDSLKIVNISKLIYNGLYNEPCHGSSEGEIDINTVIGGRLDRYYNWKDSTGLLPATQSKLKNIPAGSYWSIVNDGYCYDSANIVLKEPLELLLSEYDSNEVRCFGAKTGSITMTTAGGVPPYIYSWSHDPGLTDSSALNLGAGNYIVTVTDKALCKQSDTVSLTQPSDIKVQGVISDFNGWAVQCFDSMNGSILIHASGGVGPYTYLWRNDGGNRITPPDTIISNLAGNTNYYLIVSDKQNCKDTTQYYLNQPTKLSVTLTLKDKVCSAPGWIAAGVSGGVPYDNDTYHFSWSNGGTGDTIKNLEAGIYNLTVSDKNSCTANNNATISAVSSMQANIIVIDSIKCAGSANGKLGVTIQSGTEPISYFWDSLPGPAVLQNVDTGWHKVRLTDVNQCTAFDSVDLTQPPALEAMLTITDARCFDSTDASVNLEARGGSGNISYFWNENLVNAGMIDNLKAGINSLLIEDGNNCQIDSTIIITQPDQIVIDTFDTKRPVCEFTKDGIIRTNASGGSGSFIYNWPIEGVQGNELSGVAAGDYKIEVTDIVGCSAGRVITLKNLLAACLDIPTAFTPDGDGHNDIWEITVPPPIDDADDIPALYPDLVIEVFNRVGQKIWVSQKGYPSSEAWKGLSNIGSKLPVDSYYYIIYVNNGSGVVLNGIITIIR